MAEDDLLSVFPYVVTLKEFSELIQLNERNVQSLIKEGIVVRDAKLRIIFEPSLQNYISRMRKRAAGHGEIINGKSLASTRATLTELQSEEVTIRIARQRGELVNIQDVADSWSDIAQIVRSEALALPSRIGRSIPHLTAHDRVELGKEVRDMLKNIAEQLVGADVPGSAGGAEFENDMPAIKAKPKLTKLKSNAGRPRKK